MRKSTMFKFLIGSMFLITCSNLNAQDLSIKWDFPLKPGMEEWKKLTSHKAMVDVCQIPENVLPALSTDELVNLCLNYPLFFTMTAFNNLQDGYNQVCSEFNGFQELYRRADAGKAVLKVYCTVEPKLVKIKKTLLEKGLYKQKIFFIEFILSQPSIINNLAISDIKLLLSEALVKLDEKARNNYSSFSILPTPLVMCRVLETKKFSKYEILSHQIGSIPDFSRTVMLIDEGIIEQLRSMTVDYLNSVN